MKRCPACGRTFTNNTLVNCLNDGTALVEDAPAPPPYFGASPAAPLSAETPPSFTETPPSFTETPGTATYTDTPLSAIPELQSPEMQAALKEALDKAGMSGLLGADSAHSTISIKTSITSGQSRTPFDTGTPPSHTGTAAPRRKPRSRLGLFLLLVLLFLVVNGLRVFWHQLSPSVPAGSAAAPNKH